jgi:phospholipid/cholesterol/gamma-HCH transport system substrate-binding protein
MNESNDKRTVGVGLFVFLGLSFFIAGIVMVGNMLGTFRNKMEVICLFDDVNGLQTGNNVWFSGVKVGTVGDMRFNDKSQVEVHINIETKTQQHIRKDASVRISNDGLMGNKILIIFGGTFASPEVNDGDTLLVQKTLSTEGLMNTLQENNKNLLAITADIKVISKKIVAGEGTLGKLLADETVYNQINASTASLQQASAKAQELMNTLAAFGLGLNKKGTLANDLTTDTVVFNSIKTSVMHLQQIADTANVLMTNLKQASNNPNTSMGVLIHDEEAGAQLKETIKNLESSSQKLDEDLEALQHSFLLRGFFKKKAKASKSD